MDSDDDMHEAADVESLDYDFYGGETDDSNNNSDDDDDHVEDTDDDSDVIAAHRYRQNCTVMTEADIQQRQEDDIARASAVLSISRDAAIILLRHCNWRVSEVHDAWFGEGGVREDVGLLEGPVVQYPEKAREITCGICFEDCCRDEIYSATCGHPFCGTCWTGYISASINDGPGCLSLRCPAPSCRAAVGKSMVDLLAPDEEKRKYSLYLLRSYIEDNRKTKWCPAPGCEHALEFDAGGESGYDVSCACSCNFCWNCTEEAHRPVDCGTVSKWIRKNSDESENTNWILANAKPCPKCRVPIEKNQGCMHMTCRKCRFEFCWLCLSTWSAHGYSMSSCNSYNKAGKGDEAERKREMAKQSLERYAHYYERWAANESSRQKALTDLVQMQNGHIEKLRVKQGETESQVKFITEAWQQIVECRRVLKWTYAYGYYLPEHGREKKGFFEFSQGEAESHLERLHHCAEKELHQFLDDIEEAAASSSRFKDFHEKLAGLTSVTKNYFEKLVRALENGLSDVASKTAAGGGSTSSSSQTDDDPGYWPCDRCTFLNVLSSGKCQMCHGED